MSTSNGLARSRTLCPDRSVLVFFSIRHIKNSSLMRTIVIDDSVSAQATMDWGSFICTQEGSGFAKYILLYNFYF